MAKQERGGDWLNKRERSLTEQRNPGLSLLFLFRARGGLAVGQWGFIIWSSKFVEVIIKVIINSLSSFQVCVSDMPLFGIVK